VLLGLGRADAGPHTAPRRYRHYGQSGAHKVAGIRHAIEACGAELHYLPPYSPDLNPIENAFAKLKAHVRKSAARTLDALERAAANALQQFKPDECANFFGHAGYGLD
jgi:transposase